MKTDISTSDLKVLDTMQEIKAEVDSIPKSTFSFVKPELDNLAERVENIKQKIIENPILKININDICDDSLIQLGNNNENWIYPGFDTDLILKITQFRVKKASEECTKIELENYEKKNRIYWTEARGKRYWELAKEEVINELKRIYPISPIDIDINEYLKKYIDFDQSWRGACFENATKQVIFGRIITLVLNINDENKGIFKGKIATLVGEEGPIGHQMHDILSKNNHPLLQDMGKSSLIAPHAEFIGGLGAWIANEYIDDEVQKELATQSLLNNLSWLYEQFFFDSKLGEIKEKDFEELANTTGKILSPRLKERVLAGTKFHIPKLRDLQHTAEHLIGYTLAYAVWETLKTKSPEDLNEFLDTMASSFLSPNALFLKLDSLGLLPKEFKKV